MTSRFKQGARKGETGFTLIELMVALAIFSTAAIALLKLQGASAQVSLAVQEKMLAGIVAENRLIEIITQPGLPDLGRDEGETAMAGRAWQWSARVSQAPGADLLRIDVEAGLAGSAHVLAARTAFRGRS